MAKKQTLKSLLGGADRREQVELNLGTPALNPTVQRAGQYRVAVQQTPKTNSALQLAQALRVTPQVLGQATNVAKGLGAEAAINVTDVEEAMLDDETKGILGYDRAYQQGLVKRHFAMNEEVIKERFMNLASSDDYLKLSPEEFVDAVGEQRQQFNDELMEQFGGNANREQAIQALSSTFVDGIIDSTNNAWVTNKQEQTEMMASGYAQTMMFDPRHGYDAAMKQLSGELGAIGISPKLKAQKMRNATLAGITVAIGQGKLSEAESMIKEADAYKIQGAGRLFGSKEGIENINTIKVALEDAVEDSAQNLDAFKGNAELANDTLPNLFLDAQMAFDIKRQGIINTLIAAQIPEEDAAKIADENFNEEMKPNDFWQAWRSVAAEQAVIGNDATKTIMGSIQDDNFRITKENLFVKPISGLTTQEQYTEAYNTMDKYRKENPTATLRDIPLGPNISKTDPKIAEMFDNTNVIVKWRNDESSNYNFLSSKFTTEITNDNDLGITYAGQFQSILRDEAQDVWDNSGRDMKQFNTDIEVKSLDIIKDIREQAKIDNAIKQRLKDYVDSADKQASMIKDARDRDDPLGLDKFRDDEYPILQSDEKNPNVSALMAERSRMSKDKYATELTKGSLLLFGFPTLESYDEKLRAKARLGFQDFELGLEVYQSLLDAEDAWDLDNPTPEQQKAIKFWEKKGYRSSDEITAIIEAQNSYHALTY